MPFVLFYYLGFIAPFVFAGSLATLIRKIVKDEPNTGRWIFLTGLSLLLCMFGCAAYSAIY